MRWLMLLILFLVRISMGYQFQSVASSSEYLIADLGLSYAQIGTLIGFFLLPGVVIAIPSGAMTRAFSDKNLLMFGALTMAVGGLFMGLADDYTALYWGRLITGIGGTIFNLVLTKMVTEWFVNLEIVFALSVMLTAWPIGIALGLLTQGAIADALSWHWIMFVAAFGALVAVILIGLFYRAPPQDPAESNERLRFTLPRRQFVHISLIGIAWTLFNASLIVLVSFEPAALVGHGYHATEARSITSLFMWVTLISLPLGGQIMGRMTSVTTTLSVSLLIAAACAAAITFNINAVACTIAYGVFVGIPGGALMSLSTQAITPTNRGPGLGIFYTWYFLGMTISPAIAGWLRDTTTNPNAPVLFAAAALAAVPPLVWLFRWLQTHWSIDGDKAALNESS